MGRRRPRAPRAGARAAALGALLLLPLAAPAGEGAGPQQGARQQGARQEGARQEARFLFALAGHPAGVVTLSRAGGTYRYRSTHLFAFGEGEATREREEVHRVDAEGRTPAGHVPAGLWLWHRPAPGCVPGLEELDGRTGPLCAGAGPAGAVRGTLRGVPFRAAYAPDGTLAALELPRARFTRLPAGAGLPGVGASPALLDALAAGVPLPPGTAPLAWSPALPTPPAPAGAWREAGARALARRVAASFPEKGFDAADVDASREEVRRGGCLAHALRFARWARGGGGVQVVHGLVADGGRLLPHAWVRVGLAGGGTLALDPALGVEVTPGSHLALGVEADGEGARLGERWLEVLGGALRPVRREGPPGAPP
jgi:hypothetical protein